VLEKKPERHYSDRPLECGECKKPIAVRYTEIVGNNIVDITMCSDCPELQRRLYGTSLKDYIQSQAGVGAALECGNCGTTLEEVKRGNRLGCSECYNVFADVLLNELQAAGRLTPRITAGRKGLPAHIGRAPGETIALNPSSRLLALDEALNETIKREDYEQAAWLRDQIKALTEKSDLPSQPPETDKGEGENESKRK